MTLRLLIFITFLFFLFSTTSGQSSSNKLDSLVKSYITKLRATGVDTVLIYKDFCAGCEYKPLKVEDRCSCDFFIPTYIFWKRNGKTLMTRKDNCFDYSIINVDNDSLWQFFFSQKDKFKKEKIRMPKYIVVENNEKVTYFLAGTEDDFHQIIQIFIKQDTIFNKDIQDSYFVKEVEPEKTKNLNYHYSINALSKRLQLIIEQTIQTETNNQQLTKNRR